MLPDQEAEQLIAEMKKQHEPQRMVEMFFENQKGELMMKNIWLKIMEAKFSLKIPIVKERHIEYNEIITEDFNHVVDLQQNEIHDVNQVEDLNRVATLLTQRLTLKTNDHVLFYDQVKFYNGDVHSVFSGFVDLPETLTQTNAMQFLCNILEVKFPSAVSIHSKTVEWLQQNRPKVYGTLKNEGIVKDSVFQATPYKAFSDVIEDNEVEPLWEEGEDLKPSPDYKTMFEHSDNVAFFFSVMGDMEN
jgi:hypothetical protein